MSFNRNEQGQTLVLFAIMLFAIMVFVAFVTDVGMLYHDKSQLDAAVSLAASSGIGLNGCNRSDVQNAFNTDVPNGTLEPVVSVTQTQNGNIYGCFVKAQATFPIMFNGLLGSKPTITMSASAGAAN